jgi:hypothetical protein
VPGKLGITVSIVAVPQLVDVVIVGPVDSPESHTMLAGIALHSNSADTYVLVLTVWESHKKTVGNNRSSHGTHEVIDGGSPVDFLTAMSSGTATFVETTAHVPDVESLR